MRNTSRHVDPEETIDIICVWDIKKRNKEFLFGWLDEEYRELTMGNGGKYKTVLYKDIMQYN